MNKDEVIIDLKRIITALVCVLKEHRVSDRTMERVMQYSKDKYGITKEGRVPWP